MHCHWQGPGFTLACTSVVPGSVLMPRRCGCTSSRQSNRLNLDVRSSEAYFRNLSSTIFLFLRSHLWQTGVSRLGVQSELQLLAYVTATETQGSEPHLWPITTASGYTKGMLGISYTWSHTIFVLLYWAYFALHNIFKAYLWGRIATISFLF